MKPTLMIVFCGAAILASGCSTLDKSDSAALQGAWEGQETAPPTEGACWLMISGNALELRCADTNEWYKGTFTLREDADPRQLVGTITECPAPQFVGKTAYAIYQIDAGTLTLTGNRPGSPEVPVSFDAAGSRRFVFKKQ